MNPATTNTSANAFVAALLQQQQQPATRGRTQQAPSLLGANAVGAPNALTGSGAVQPRQTAGRGGRVVSQPQQQATSFGTQQNIAPAGSMAMGQPAAGRGRSASTRGRTARQQQQAATAAAAPVSQMFGPNATAPIQGIDQQALAALLGGAPAGGAVSQQRQQTSVRRARTPAAATNSANFLPTEGVANVQQRQQTNARRARSAATPVGADTLGVSAAGNTGLGLTGGALADQQQQQLWGQTQQRATAPRRARSAAASASTDGALGSNVLSSSADDANLGDAVDGVGAASNKNKYVLVDEAGNRLGPVYRNAGAYGAALKAATTGHSNIYLWDRDHPASEGGRVYSYVGGTAPITKPSAFTQEHGITTRPIVKSRGYVDLDANFRPIQRQ